MYFKKIIFGRKRVFNRNISAALIAIFIVTAWLQVLIFYMPALARQSVSEGKIYSSDSVLSAAMALMNKHDFASARMILKTAIQKEPYDDLLWVTYESCIRSEMIYKESGADITADSAMVESPAEVSAVMAVKAANSNEIEMSSGKADDLNNAGALIENKTHSLQENILPGDSEKDINCSILEADFSSGCASGDLACLLNDTFKFINTGGVSYLSARAKDKNATVSFSFKISKFPKKIKLLISHRLVKKDRFLSSAPLLIELNEKKVNYDPIRLGNKIEISEYDITNMSNAASNILTLSVENSNYPYLLKNVKILLYYD